MKNLLKLLFALALVGSIVLPSMAAPPQTSGIIVSINDVPAIVTETNLRIVSTGRGKPVDMTLPAYNFTSFRIALKAGTYTLVLIPVSTEGGIYVPPSIPVVVEVERKQFTPVTLSFTPEPQ